MAAATTKRARRLPAYPLFLSLEGIALLLMAGFYTAFIGLHQLTVWPALAAWDLALLATLGACVQASRVRRWAWLGDVLLGTAISNLLLPGLGALRFGLVGPTKRRPTG